MKRPALLTTAIALGLAGCATSGTEDEPLPDMPATASADLRDSGGRTVGHASVTESGDGLRVRIEATGLPPGAHGAHLHAVGACDAPDFASAGPHWNPTDRQHGTQNPQGPHRGDLPNLLVGTDGRGTLEFVVPAARVARGRDALLDRDGAALVIHAAADDYRTDPSGNSGARIACGAFG